MFCSRWGWNEFATTSNNKVDGLVQGNEDLPRIHHEFKRVYDEF